jgi:hypothetical protein
MDHRVTCPGQREFETCRFATTLTQADPGHYLTVSPPLMAGGRNPAYGGPAVRYNAWTGLFRFPGFPLSPPPDLRR